MRFTLVAASLLAACSSQLPSPAVAPEPSTESTAPSSGAGGVGGAGAAPSEPAEPQPTACTRDSHCTLSTFAGCCVCCPRQPRAFFKPDLAKMEAKCGSVRCPSCYEDCGPAVDVTTYVAQCVEGRCVAEPR